jgi:hypothetical protein
LFWIRIRFKVKAKLGSRGGSKWSHGGHVNLVADLDPDPHQSKKLDPDRHQSEK